MLETDASTAPFVFAPEPVPACDTPCAAAAVPWKVLVVDDAADVLAVTRLALEGLTLLERPVALLYAHSAQQAREVFARESDIALALVDVVMETDTAGLDWVRWVRQEGGNTRMRIVMRTGQAAQVPEDRVVREYEIDDFREKSDMTVQKLRTVVLSKLRAFNDLCTIEAQRQALEVAVEFRTRELAQAQDKLMQSDKLASIGQLAAGVAHEINNPIGYIFSNFGALQQYVEDLYRVLDAYAALEPLCVGTAALHQLQACQAEVDVQFVRQDIAALLKESGEGIGRVRQIVQDLKDFSRSDSMDQWVYADINRGVMSTLNVARNEIKHRAQVQCALAELPAVQCLPSQINQVLLNLLVNAAHAMAQTPGEIEVATGVEGNTVWIRVRDNGCGMSSEVQARIFEPFFTTKPVGQGTGLGLSLSYGIVQKHHGSIAVESTPGVGTCFTVRLPVEQGNQSAPSFVESRV